MDAAKRIFLSWPEAAEALGLDSEGFRQHMLHSWSNADSNIEAPWLRAMVGTRGGEFLTSLRWNSWDTQITTPQWCSRDTFYRVVEGDHRWPDVQFSDGSRLPLRGREGDCGWHAAHDDGTGFSMSFRLWGESLVVHPECVRDACNAEGYLDSLFVAPYGWCEPDFPDLCFRVSRPENTAYRSKPDSLFSAAYFLATDVLQMKALMAGKATEPKVLASREENSYLSITAAMLALLRIPRNEGGGGFPSEAKLIQVLVDKFGAVEGVSKRKLEEVFAAAKRQAGDLQKK